MSIRDEIAGALEEVGSELVGSPFTLDFVRAAESDTPWGSGTPEPFSDILALDKGQMNKTPRGESIEVSMRVFLLQARSDYEPQIGDSTTINSREYKVRYVEYLSPSGEDLMYTVGLVD